MTPLALASGLALLLRLGDVLDDAGIARREVSLAPADGKSYRAALYWPDGSPSATLPGIYLQHGMTVTGSRDPRLEAFARDLASSGFAVLVPELPSIAGLRLDPSAVGEIEALFVEMTRRSDLVDGARCGFAAAGFSAGMGLAAMCRPSVREKVAAVLGVGAHARFGETVASAVADPDGDPYGAFLVLANFVEGMFPASGALQRAFAECAARACVGRPLPRPEEAEGLGERDRSVLASAVGDKTYRRALVHDVLARIPPSDVDLLSPARQVGPLACPVVLLHGERDPMVPADEARFLAAKLRAAGVEVRLVVTPALSHGDRQPLWRALPDVPRLTSALARFVEAVRA